MKKVLSVLLCVLLLVPTAACSVFDKPDAGGFIQAMTAMDTGALVNLICANDEDGNAIADGEAVAQRVAAVWSGLGVTAVTVTDDGEAAGSSDLFTTVAARAVTITYTCDTIGTFSFEAVAQFARVDDAWQLIWNYDLLLPTMQETDTVTVSRIAPTRGEIFTSDRVCVARNVFAPTVYVDPSAMESAESAAAALAPVVGMDASEILAILNSDATARDGVAVIKVYSPTDDLTQLRASLSQIAGAGIDESYMSPVRLYPYDGTTCSLSNLVGYVGAIPAESLDAYLEAGYDAYDTVGLSGLEAAYEETLRGTPGYLLTLTDSAGATRKLAQKSAVSGCDLTLTINARIQLTAEQQLQSQLSAGQSGSVIVMNPETGAVLAMASYPTYDNNFFTLPVTDEAAHQAQYEAILGESSNSPLLFRCIQGLFVPGSTAKVMTASIALDSGTMTADYVFTGTVVGRTWYPSISDWYYPGITRHTTYSSTPNMTNALIYSDNIYYANAALMIGAETYVDYLTKFGFFDSVPFDLSVSSAQISSGEDRTLVENIKYLADLGYGQGEMQTTPLQIACIYSAFANEGSVMRPYVVASVSKTDGTENDVLSTTEPEVWKDGIVSASTVTTLRGMMRKVVESGTATTLNIAGLGICGKTGTAEAGTNKQHSWFIGFTTEGDEPRLVCVTLAVAENQGTACQPIAKAMFLADGSESLDEINAQVADGQ